ncbi:MAG: enoyl-CoA hydratase [Pseudomonas sp.]|jgi:enoyl-CoA hydratase|nr:enoyl-CoA hydratase [Pseudomonas sp.]MDD2222004.1 enoyl-CoA hydratase [Pseudomonas sp.]NLO54989.1 enoyl-CoA hydratase [Gammaproteobacteria bacterium]
MSELDKLTPRVDESVYETDEPVQYRVEDGIAILTMSRPKYNNVQNSQMTYALDDLFARAINDDNVKVIMLTSTGKHFSAGHDIGTPGRDVNKAFERKSLWWDHSNKPGGEFLYAREQEVYLNMCRRWREMPKPTIAVVQGGCIAGGLMLAWVCDFIVASDDAFFQDPVVRMGIPGVEYFAHAFEMHPRIAKEFLMLGDRMPAARAYELGMVNRVVARDELHNEALKMAQRIATQPRMGLALTKQAINHIEDLQGKRTGMEAAFAWHHFAHVHNEQVSGDKLAGFDGKSMAAQNKAEASGGDQS